MAENVPVSEVRRVVIEYVVQGPAWQKAPASAASEPMPSIRELADAVRRELIKTGFRNPDIFGGRA